MKESILIAIEVYFLAFVVAIFIAALIKGMIGVIKRISPKDVVNNEISEGK